MLVTKFFKDFIILHSFLEMLVKKVILQLFFSCTSRVEVLRIYYIKRDTSKEQRKTQHMFEDPELFERYSGPVTSMENNYWHQYTLDFYFADDVYVLFKGKRSKGYFESSKNKAFDRFLQWSSINSLSVISSKPKDIMLLLCLLG